jgi:hypothetical protein
MTRIRTTIARVRVDETRIRTMTTTAPLELDPGVEKITTTTCRPAAAGPADAHPDLEQTSEKSSASFAAGSPSSR